MAFEVSLRGAELGLVKPSSSSIVNQQLEQRAKNTIKLYELDKTTTADGAADRRYILRLKAIQMAADRRVEFEKNQATVAAIVDMARTTGFFPVWFEIFSDVPSVKSALISDPQFGLDASWFDQNLNPKPRTTLDFF